MRYDFFLRRRVDLSTAAVVGYVFFSANSDGYYELLDAASRLSSRIRNTGRRSAVVHSNGISALSVDRCGAFVALELLAGCNGAISFSCIPGCLLGASSFDRKAPEAAVYDILDIYGVVPFESGLCLLGPHLHD